MIFSHLLNTVNTWNPNEWDTGGGPTFTSDGLNEDVASGEYKWARSKWYLTGDFDIQAYVTITDRPTPGKSHWTTMWISRESDNQCFAAHRNTWNTSFQPNWRGWDSCSGSTTMNVAPENTAASIAISRILRVGSRIRTYVKHNLQVGWPDSSWILTGDDNSFFSGVPGNADCNVTLASESRAAGFPIGSVTWQYIDVVSGTVVNP